MQPRVTVRTALLAIAATLVLCAAPGAFAQEQRELQAQPCLPPGIADGARIVVLGAGSGGQMSNFAMGESGSEIGIVSVSAARRGPPLVLVVSGSDPIVWDLRGVPARRLRAVIAYGEDDQGLAGLPTSVPLRFVGSESEDHPCGAAAHAEAPGDDLEALEASIQTALGRGIDSFNGAHDPVRFEIDEGRVLRAGPPLTLADVRAEVQVRLDRIWPREAGLEQLMQEGSLRAANFGDMLQLGAAIARARGPADTTPIQALGIGAGTTWVVMRPITMPKGMYGGYSATFVIARGVPDPIDPGSHNLYYRLADGSCRRCQ